MASAYARIFGNRVSASVNPISAHLIMPYRKQLNVLLTRFDYVQRMYKERAPLPAPSSVKLYNNILGAYLLWGAIKISTLCSDLSHSSCSVTL